MSKKLGSAVAAALVLASALALASCAGGTKPAGGIPLDNGADCTKVAFPQCGRDGAH